MMSENELLLLATRAATEAGEAILDIYNSKELEVEFKNDNSPLTAADKAAHQIITKALAPSGLPLLSEEGRGVAFAERATWSRFWLVDPLDGTKEFLQRNGEFTVNIALVQDSAPVSGVVYAPFLDTLFWGSASGAFKIERGMKVALPSVEKRSLHQIQQTNNPTVVSSRSHRNSETEQFIEGLKNPILRSMGSSLKFMLLAQGIADVYPRLAPTMEWDTAAAHAILLACNRNIYLAGTNEALSYNKENLLNPSFIAY